MFNLIYRFLRFSFHSWLLFLLLLWNSGCNWLCFVNIESVRSFFSILLYWFQLKKKPRRRVVYTIRSLLASSTTTNTKCELKRRECHPIEIVNIVVAKCARVCAVYTHILICHASNLQNKIVIETLLLFFTSTRDKLKQNTATDTHKHTHTQMNQMETDGRSKMK